MIQSHAATGAALLDIEQDDQSSPIPGGVRESTRLNRRHAVERVIDTMQERVAEPLSLVEMARIAMFSPYHFHRMFRCVTGLPPAQFLSAVRMATACRLLLTTQMRVTEVCYEVGFGSLGTFTTRFGRLVGAPPQHLRWLAARHADRPLATIVAPWDARAQPRPAVTGWIDTPRDRGCIATLGLFTGDCPQGLPIACTVVRGPGPFSFGPVPEGRYSVLAAGFPAVTVIEATLLERSRLLVGMLAEPIMCRPHVPVVIHLAMRTASIVDPPIVLAAPLLLAELAGIANTRQVTAASPAPRRAKVEHALRRGDDRRVALPGEG